MSNKFYQGQRVRMTGLVPIANKSAEGMTGTIAYHRVHIDSATWMVNVHEDPNGLFTDATSLWFYEDQIHPELEVPVFASPEDALRWFDED